VGNKKEFHKLRVKVDEQAEKIKCLQEENALLKSKQVASQPTFEAAKLRTFIESYVHSIREEIGIFIDRKNPNDVFSK